MTNINEMCMVLYSSRDNSVQIASECLDDKFPIALNTGQRLDARAWKLFNIGHENYFQPLYDPSLGQAHQLPEYSNDTNIDFIMAKDCHTKDSPVLVYSTQYLNPDDLNTNPWAGLVGDLEKRLPSLYQAAVHTENGPSSAQALMENGAYPSVIYWGENPLYPTIETNQTCMCENGNLQLANGEYKGNPGKIMDGKHETSINMLMLASKGDSAIVYMPKEKDYDFREILSPNSPPRKQIGSMYQQLQKTY